MVELLTEESIKTMAMSEPIESSKTSFQNALLNLHLVMYLLDVSLPEERKDF